MDVIDTASLRVEHVTAWISHSAILALRREARCRIVTSLHQGELRNGVWEISDSWLSRNFRIAGHPGLISSCRVLQGYNLVHGVPNCAELCCLVVGCFELMVGILNASLSFPFVGVRNFSFFMGVPNSLPSFRGVLKSLLFVGVLKSLKSSLLKSSRKKPPAHIDITRTGRRACVN